MYTLKKINFRVKVAHLIQVNTRNFLNQITEIFNELMYPSNFR